MPAKFIFKSQFNKAYDRLNTHEQQLVVKALEALKGHFAGGSVTHGLGIKKLFTGGKSKIFEARLSLSLRIVWVEARNEAIFCLLGSHDEVRRFIKSL